MFYRMYLSSVCNRRQWPDPYYEPWSTRNGHYCKVTVNNREYRTDVAYANEDLARDNAAMKAFMICRNFSANDGMFPGQRPGQASFNGIIQGRPVAIGHGRKGKRDSGSPPRHDSVIGMPASSDGSRSASNSPPLLHAAHLVRDSAPPRRYTRNEKLCSCGRGYPVVQYHRCELCLTYGD